MCLIHNRPTCTVQKYISRMKFCCLNMFFFSEHLCSFYQVEKLGFNQSVSFSWQLVSLFLFFFNWPDVITREQRGIGDASHRYKVLFACCYYKRWGAWDSAQVTILSTSLEGNASYIYSCRNPTEGPLSKCNCAWRCWIILGKNPALGCAGTFTFYPRWKTFFFVNMGFPPLILTWVQMFRTSLKVFTIEPWWIGNG